MRNQWRRHVCTWPEIRLNVSDFAEKRKKVLALIRVRHVVTAPVCSGRGQPGTGAPISNGPHKGGRQTAVFERIAVTSHFHLPDVTLHVNGGLAQAPDGVERRGEPSQ